MAAQATPDGGGTSGGPGGLVAAVIGWADRTQRRHTAFGFPYAVIKKYGDDAGGRHAALITYYGFLSLFPILLLAVVAVTNLLASNPELRSQVIDNIIPPEFRETVDNAVLSLPTGGVPLVVGIIGLFLSGTGIVFSTYDTLNHLAAVPHCERLAFIPRYLRGFAMLAVLLVSVVGMGGFAVVSAELPDVAGFPRIASAAGVLAIAFAMLLLAPTLLVARRTPISGLWPAALLGAVAVAALLLVFGPLLAQFVARSGPVYGSFATIVGLFALLYLACQVLVYAAEVAVVRRAHLWPRAIDSSDPTPADERALTLLAQMERRTAPERISVRFERPSR